MDFKGINYAKKAYKEALKKTPKYVFYYFFTVKI